MYVFLRVGWVSALCMCLLPRISHSNELKQHQVKASLFIFGDSLYDAGANNYINTTAAYRANFRPYGETFFNYPSGRFSDGRLIPDFIAEYAGLPLIPPYLQPNYHFNGGANFASGGAGALVETHAGFVVDLHMQLRQFMKLEKQLKKELGDAKGQEAISEAVYMFSVGANDYFATNSTLFQSHSHEEYVAMVIGNLTTVLKSIHNKGGKKFGFVQIPPIGCLPGTRVITGNTSACFTLVNKLAKIHNSVLPKGLRKLQTQLDGFKYSIFDLYDIFLERINHPSRYGFVEGMKACCGSGPYGGTYSCGGQRGVTEYDLCKDPREYFFFDSSHPSERAYKQFAELMWSGGHDIIWPYNLKALFEA